MVKKSRFITHILLPLLLLVFPPGLYFILRLDVHAVDFMVRDRSDYLHNVLTNVDYSFSSYEQLLFTAITIVESLPSDRQVHEGALNKILTSSRSSLVYGIGIWYEPYAFDSETQRFGPYIRQVEPMSDDMEITYTWNTAEYDYHNRSWYRLAMEAEGDDVAVTPPFFDQDYTYITFGKPFYKDGRKAGVITVDIILPLLQAYFESFDFSFFSGVYLTTSDDSIVLSKTMVGKDELYEFSLNGEHPGLFSERTSKYREEEITDFFISLKQKPEIVSFETRNGVFRIHGFLDRRSLFLLMVRRHLFNYVFYFFFWTFLVTVLIIIGRYQSRMFENRLLNTENERLKDEVRRRVHAEERLEFLAFHDDVSGLNNIQSLVISERVPVKDSDPRSLIYISLINMRELSLFLAESLIDEVVKVFAQRLEQTCPEDVHLYRGRGFSFYVVSRSDGRDNGESLAEELLLVFRRPMKMGSRDIRLRVRIGLVRFSDADSFDQLLSMSHSTVTDESSKDIDRISLYSQTLQESKTRSLLLDTAMSQPGFTDELVMVYQPIVECHKLRAVGSEALVRWNSRALNSLISPAEFIPLAEENGVIITLGWHVIEEVLKTLSGPLSDREFYITVNVSPLQFLEIDFPDKLDMLLEQYQVNKSRIKLEITESSAASVIESFWQIADELIARGYLLAIDDFGTGESSFHRLYHMSFDSLKIDRSFVSGVLSGSRNQEICRSLLEIGKTMGSRVIAEGVETEEELLALRETGIEYVQGYHLSRPVSLDDLLKHPLLD